MGFQLKDFTSITASMINRARATQTKVTDFNVGSVARTLMEGPAIEIEELYQRMFAGIMDAIPVAIYRGFDFELSEPTVARGTVVVHFQAALETAITLPAGMVFLAPATGNRYLSVAAVTAPQGAQSAAVVVEAENPGAAYNVGANAIQRVLTSGVLPSGATFTNAPITSGSDGEGEEERKERFARFIQSLSRSTLFSCEYAAATAMVRNEAGQVTERVTRVGSDELPGQVSIYVYGADQIASAALVAAAQRIIDGYYDSVAQVRVAGYRPAGVNVLVSAMQEQARNIAVTVDMLPGATFGSSVSNEIITRVTAVLDKVEPGKTLYVADVRAAALQVPGVGAVRLDLTANYVCPKNIVLVPGNVTVGVA